MNYLKSVLIDTFVATAGTGLYVALYLGHFSDFDKFFNYFYFSYFVLSSLLILKSVFGLLSYSKNMSGPKVLDFLGIFSALFAFVSYSAAPIFNLFDKEIVAFEGIGSIWLFTAALISLRIVYNDLWQIANYDHLDSKDHQMEERLPAINKQNAA